VGKGGRLRDRVLGGGRGFRSDLRGGGGPISGGGGRGGIERTGLRADEHPAVLDPHLVLGHGALGRRAEDRTGADVEGAVVERAVHDVPQQSPLVEVRPLVGARGPDSEELALDLRQQYPPVVDLEADYALGATLLR
jgi:hypothetical protein